MSLVLTLKSSKNAFGTQSGLNQMLSSPDPRRTCAPIKCTAKQGIDSHSFSSKTVQGLRANFCECPKVWCDLREQRLQNLNGFNHSKVHPKEVL